MTLVPEATTSQVAPYYVGGPLDGGVGPIEPIHSVLGVIRRAGGAYGLIGFQLAQDYVADVTVAMRMPDRAVYQWEVVK